MGGPRAPRARDAPAARPASAAQSGTAVRVVEAARRGDRGPVAMACALLRRQAHAPPSPSEGLTRMTLPARVNVRRILTDTPLARLHERAILQHGSRRHKPIPFARFDRAKY